ncbi:methyltransferase domain-containing protein [Chloroflexota bacterium]
MQIGQTHLLCSEIEDNTIAEKLNAILTDFVQDIACLDPLKLNISEYNQHYLQVHQRGLQGSMYRIACVVGGALVKHNRPLSELVLLDYGGGIGLLSLLATRLGVGTVIYNDIYDVSCRDASELGITLGCKADYYVCGDIDDVVSFCQGLGCDAIVSSDVIEHIYNIDHWLGKLQLLCNDGATVVHATGVSMTHYPARKWAMREQTLAETRGRKKEWGYKERDCFTPYYADRLKIISNYANTLNEDELGRLAYLSRGLAKEDILRAVNHYIETGQSPSPIGHPTNTCDPYTGNWMEHLMNPYYLSEVLRCNGFVSHVLPIFLNESSGGLKGVEARILNLLMRIPMLSFSISRGYALYGKYEGVVSESTNIHSLYGGGSQMWLQKPVWELLLKAYRLLNRKTQAGHV